MPEQGPGITNASYVFRAEDAVHAAKVLDEAYADSLYWPNVVDALRGGSKDPSSQQRLTPLELAIQRVALFVLRVSLAGEPPGCELGPQWDEGEHAYPARIHEVAASEVRLWREAVGYVRNPAARARLYDLLYVRAEPPRPHFALMAARAYLDAVDLTAELSMSTTEMLMRAWDISRRMSLWDLHQEAHTAMAMAAQTEIRQGGYSPGAVLPLISAICSRPTKRQPQAATTLPAGSPTTEQLIRMAIGKYKAEHILAELFGYLRKLTSDKEQRQLLGRQEADELLSLARHQQGLARQAALEATIRRSRELGCPDIGDEATRLLQQMRHSDLDLKPLSTEVILPRDWHERFVEQFTRPRDWRTGLRFFMQTDAPTGSYADLERQEESTRGTSFTRLITRVTLTGEGLPRVTSSTPEAEQAAEIAWLAGFPAAQHGILLAEALHAVRLRYGEISHADLTEFLSRSGQVDPNMARILAYGFLHFWAGDMLACIHVVVPQIENAARALLLELDEAVYRVQVGQDPGGYIGLHNLLEALEPLGLDRDWAYYLRWLLIAPGGPNLRNDVAHGLMLDATPPWAAHALRAAALLIDLVAPDAVRQQASAGRSPAALRARLAQPVDPPALLWPNGPTPTLDRLSGFLEGLGRKISRAGTGLRRLSAAPDRKASC